MEAEVQPARPGVPGYQANELIALRPLYLARLQAGELLRLTPAPPLPPSRNRPGGLVAKSSRPDRRMDRRTDSSNPSRATKAWRGRTPSRSWPHIAMRRLASVSHGDDSTPPGRS